MKKITLMLVVLLAFTWALISLQAEEGQVQNANPPGEEKMIPEPTTLEKARYLYEKELFSGVLANSFTPALELETSGEQALKIIGSALGWPAMDFKETTFKDVSDWAIPYVEYARRVGITTGVGQDRFGAEYIDGRRVITWMLASYGMDKDDVWANTEKYARDFELPIDQKEKLTRGDLVDIIYAAVKEGSKIQAYQKNIYEGQLPKKY